MFNYLKIRALLDKSAEELEAKGFEDLADKVDALNARLETATPAIRNLIAKRLSKIEKEATARDTKEAPKSDKFAAIRRKMALRKRAERVKAVARRIKIKQAVAKIRARKEASKKVVSRAGRREQIKANLKKRLAEKLASKK